MDQLLIKAIKLSAISVVATAVMLLTLNGWRWSAGLIVGAGWMMTSIYLTTLIIKTAIMPQNKKNLPGILLIKFPLLYLLAFGILISRAFPLASLGLGASAIFVSIGGLWLCPKQA